MTVDIAITEIASSIISALHTTSFKVFALSHMNIQKTQVNLMKFLTLLPSDMESIIIGRCNFHSAGSYDCSILRCP